MEFLIGHSVAIWGTEVILLLGTPAQPARNDSSIDSDSDHSVHVHDSPNDLGRHDSSIDSLVDRELYTEGGQSSGKPFKSHVTSPTNLSRDSGLTLSDSQLYDDDYNDQTARYNPGADEYTEDEADYDTMTQPLAPPRKRGMYQGVGSGDRTGQLDTWGGDSRSKLNPPTQHSSNDRQQEPSRFTRPCFDYKLQAENTQDTELSRKVASRAQLARNHETESSFHSHWQSSAARRLPSHPDSLYGDSRESLVWDTAKGSRGSEGLQISSPETPDDDLGNRIPPWLLRVIDNKSSVATDYRGRVQADMEPGYNLPSFSPLYEPQQKELSPAGDSRKEHAFQTPDCSPWHGRSHEAEDVPLTLSGQARLEAHLRQRPFVSDETQNESMSAGSTPDNGVSEYTQSPTKGLPPTRVLRGSRTPRQGSSSSMSPSRDSPSGAPVQHGGHASAVLRGARPAHSDTTYTGNDIGQTFDAASSVETIRDSEYIKVKPELTVIHREDSLRSAVSTHSSKSTSSLFEDSRSSVNSSESDGRDSVSTVTVSTSSAHSVSPSPSNSPIRNHSDEYSERPSKPPVYTTALQRTFMLQHDFPMEILNQKLKEEKARSMYEESWQRYLQERHNRQPIVTRKLSDPGTCRLSDPGTCRQVSDFRDTVKVWSCGEQPSDSDAVVNDDLYETLDHKELAYQRQAHERAKRMFDESTERFEQEQSLKAESKISQQTTSAGSHRVRDTVQHSTDFGSVCEHSAEGRSVAERETSERNVERLEVDVIQRNRLEIKDFNPRLSLSKSADRLNKLDQWSPCKKQLRDPVKNYDTKSSTRKTSDTTVETFRDKSMFSCTFQQYNQNASHGSVVNMPSTQTHQPSDEMRAVMQLQHEFESLRIPTSHNPLAVQMSSTKLSVFTSSGDAACSDAYVSNADCSRKIENATSTTRIARTFIKPVANLKPGFKGDKEQRERDWNEGDLRKLYSDEANPDSVAHDNRLKLAETIGTTLTPFDRPPPYHGPQPFQRRHDLNRDSTSSNSTSRNASPTIRGAASISTSTPPHLGPQIASLNRSEDSSCYHTGLTCNNPDSICEPESEPANIYTDISYV